MIYFISLIILFVIYNLISILIVSRTILDHHEGRIGVISQVGVGSTFYFEVKLHSFPEISSVVAMDEEAGHGTLNLPTNKMFRSENHDEFMTSILPNNITESSNSGYNNSHFIHKSINFDKSFLETNDDAKLPENTSNLPENLCFERVLIVDDSKLNRKMLHRQLKNHFQEVVEVTFSIR